MLLTSRLRQRWNESVYTAVCVGVVVGNNCDMLTELLGQPILSVMRNGR
jgi:hypothetical protein